MDRSQLLQQLQRAHQAATAGHLRRAREIHAKALKAWPDHPIPLMAAGMLEIQYGPSKRGLGLLKKAIALDPSNPEPWTNLAIAHRMLGNEADSVSLLEQVIARTPFPPAAMALGHARQRTGDHSGAVSAYRLASRDPRARQHPDLIEGLFFSSQAEADWADEPWLSDAARALMTRSHPVGSPFGLLMLEASPTQQQAMARSAAAAVAARTTPLPVVAEVDDDVLAVVTNDFRDHPMAVLMTGVLERLARRWRVIGYEWDPPVEEGPARARLQAALSMLVDVSGLDDRAAAARIRADKPVLAIDRKGWVGACRPGILAHRPAPVQIQYLAYPGTMGADWIDYLVADPVVIPPDHRAAYDEALITLPHCYQPRERPAVPPGAVDRAAAGLPAEAVVLACFVSPLRLRPAQVALWFDALAAAPQTVLWLLCWPSQAAEHLRGAAEARGLDPGRLIFAERRPHSEHIRRLGAADLGLDSFPYTGHTTTSDMLAAGVPVVTRTGETFASRVSASILQACGLGDLVAADADGWRQRVLDLVANPGAREDLRARVRAAHATAPMFDLDAYTDALAQGFEHAIQRWRRGEAAADISVSRMA